MMRTSRHVPGAAACTAVVALTLAATLAGCGGSSGGGSRHTDPATTFKAQANAICKDALAQLIDSTQGLDPKSLSQADIEKVVDGMVDTLGEERTKLKALKAPADLQAGLDTLLGSLEDAIAVARAKGAKVVEPTTDLFGQVDADAGALGLKSCAF